MYQSETAPKEIRGRLVSSFQLFITAGIFVGYAVCYGTHGRPDTSSYNIPLGLCFVWASILLVGLMFMSESPRYLISKDQIDGAKKAMSFMYRLPSDNLSIAVNVEEIVAAVELERRVVKATWIEIFRNGKSRIAYRLFLGFTLNVLQQLSGANYFFTMAFLYSNQLA